MSKHTKGPWEVVDLPHAIVVRTQSSKKTKYGADRYAAIGGFDRAEPEQLAEAMANARLIASAPELLEALKLATRQNSHDMLMTGEELRQCEAAIAKAEGKA